VTSRSLYGFLLRLHPAGFRSRFEDQMLWIFDESVQSRGAASLLFDVFVSLVRQWLLRSGYWRHSQQTIVIDGATALTDHLRRNAEALHQRAWRLNLIWMAGAFIVMPLSQLQMFSSPFMVVIFINATGLYWHSRQGRRPGERTNGYITLSLFSTPEDFRKLYRQRIEGKRDGLIEWCRFQPSKISWNANFFGGKFLLILLVVAGVAMFLRPNRPGTSFDWLALFEFLSGVMVLAVFWRFVKKANERATQAIQQEIDALEVPSKPETV